MIKDPPEMVDFLFLQNIFIKKVYYGNLKRRNCRNKNY